MTEPSGAQKRKKAKARGVDTTAWKGRKWAERGAARQQMSDRVAAIKCEKGCAHCGFNTHPAAFEFHHVGSAPKRDGIAGLVRKMYAWDIIEEEMRKCVLLCANCHRIETATQKQKAAPLA